MPTWTKEQNDAILKDKSNIIVSAGAGSGKTAVLSERVIRKLKEGVHINELLLLTFTNAAAKEMKDRIRKKMKKEGLDKELELIDQSYITTFDSYALSIVKKYNYKLNVSKNISIVDQDLITFQKENMLNDIFEELYEKEDEEFLKLINDFCVKDDNEIRNHILNISSKLDLIIDLDKYFDEYESNFYSDKYLNKVLETYSNKILGKIDNIKLLLTNLAPLVDNKYNEKILEVLKGLLSSKTYIDIKSNSSIKLPPLSKDFSDAKKYKDEIKKETDEIKKLCSYIDLNDAKENILLTKSYVKVIIRIIKELNNRLDSFKLEYDLYEFNDIAKLSIKLLKENEDIRNEIKYSLNEIMIDEYQDTSDMQEEFISLIENNNVYMVGDIKQSIYRFRNANPYIFKNKYDRYSKNDGGIKIDLNKNFRSREETLNNINTLFNLIMNSEIGGADYRLTHQMVFGNGTYNNEGKTTQNNNFEIYNYDYDKEKGFTKEETEIFIIANDIKNKIDNKYKIFDKDSLVLRDASYSDFVILLDRSKDFELYKKIFEYKGIPLSIYKDEKVNDEIILTVLKNMLVSIDKINKKEFDNDFKHSFTSILRSFIFEYTDEEIFDLYLNNNFYQDKIYNSLKEINIDSKTPKEILNILLDKFNIIDNLTKIGDIDKNLTIIEYLLNYLDTKESIGYTISDISTYLNDILEKKYEIRFSSNKESSNSVKIMTIHKSKGLEYSICYYAGLYNKFNIRDISDNFLFDKTYGIVTPFYKNGIGETIYKFLIKENYLKEEISEKIRLFYVALTRAKEKMILVTDLNGDVYNSKDEDGVLENSVRLKYRSFQDIIMSIEEELGKYVTKIEDIDITKDYELVKQYNFKDYINESSSKISVKELEKDSKSINTLTFSKKQNILLTEEEINNMNYGTKMHYLFEITDFNNPDNDIVKSFLEVYDIKDALKIYKEYEFMYEEDDIYHGVIDLMFEYNDYIDIIDYKLSNISDEAYKKQLEGYKKYIENITNKKVNVYLYSIINKELKKL